MAQPEPCWYAVQTYARSEKKVATQLEGKAVETFLPTVKEIHRWSDRRKAVEVAMLPGYAFVRVVLTPQIRLKVLQTFGVTSFVSFGGEVPSIPEQQIDELRLLSEHNINCSETPFISLGQRVRVRGGCLEGLEGIVVSRHGEKVLVLSIESIQRSISIAVGDYTLEPIQAVHLDRLRKTASTSCPNSSTCSTCS
jgi:transcription antitermination factor NusG